MKNVLILAAVMGLPVVTACAPAPLTRSDVDGLVVCNSDHMDQVEREARKRNANIQWVNCPKATLRVVS